MSNRNRPATAATANRAATRGNKRATATAVEPTATATAVEPIPEPTAAAVVTFPEPTAVEIMANRAAAMFPGVDVPAAVIHMAAAFAAVSTMPVATIDNRADVRAAIESTFVANIGERPIPAQRTIGRWFGMHVFETQNTAYAAAAVSGVHVNNGVFVAMWRAELPVAKCDFIGRAFDRAYPTSTLGDYLGGRHNMVPGVPGARAAVLAWHNANRNAPKFDANA